DRAPRRMLHHRVIDGAAPGARESLRFEPDEAQILGRPLHRKANRRDRVGLLTLIFFDEEIGPDEKIAGIPEVASLLIDFRGFEVRLLDKGLNSPRARGNGLARLDISEACLGRVRLDAEHDDEALRGCLSPRLARLFEGA